MSHDDSFSTIEEVASKQHASEQAIRALTSARARLVLGRDARSAFFATLALRLRLEVDWNCPTMQTDGRTLAYNPVFVAGLSPDECLGVLSNEVMHDALAHMLRRGQRDPVRWNIACDLAINPLLIRVGIVLPLSRLMPGEGWYTQLPKEKSAEEYYALLSESDSPNHPGDEDLGGPEWEPDDDPGGCGSVVDPPPGSASQMEADWRVAMVQAEQAARSRGELPAGLVRSVEAVLRPPLDWRQVLREFVARHARNDFSWTRPNRRFIGLGIYLPGLRSEELGDVVIAIDTSGSVGASELGAFSQAVNDILDSFDCSVTVLAHDTQVRSVRTGTSSDGPLTLDAVGGGGTSHRCIFDWIDQSGSSPACIICLTDLHTEFPTVAPPWPVIWAVVGDNSARPPFGCRVDVPS